jgi:hypothetical protein
MPSRKNSRPIAPETRCRHLGPVASPGVIVRSFIILENGIAQKGVKRLTVMYDDEQIWTGDVPMGTSESATFAIPVPVAAPTPAAGTEFQRPDIKKFRSTKSIPFPLDGV